MPIRFPLPPRKPALPAQENQKRHPVEPQPLSDDAYAKKAWNHTKAHEGTPNRIYGDPKGIPTLGSGYALAVLGDDGKYRLRPWDEIGRAIDPSQPYAFTEKEKQRLTEAVGCLNGEMPPPDPNLYAGDEGYRKKYNQEKTSLKHDEDMRTAKALSLIPPIAGAETPEKNHFGFTITEKRAQELLAEIWPDYRAAVHKELRKQARARAWSETEIDAYIEKHFKNSELEMALTSLQYNGVPSPKAIRALLDGDLARVREEILYLSNQAKDRNEVVLKGLSKRRRAEADLATGDPTGWSGRAKDDWKRIEAKPKNKAYRERFPGAFAARKIGWELSPAARRMLALAASPLADPARAVLLKPPAVWTEEEARTVMRGDDYWNADDPFARDRAQARVGAWFRQAYGNDRLRVDAVGRPVRPVPVRALPPEPARARTADGEDLNEAAAAAVAEVVRAAGDDGLDRAVRMLQLGLNRFAAPGRRITEDGDYGPETDLRLKELLALAGSAAAGGAFRRATVLDLVDGALRSGTIDTLLRMLAKATGLDAGGTGGDEPAGSAAAQMERTLRAEGSEALVRSLSDAQVSRAVHVRAHARDGGRVKVAAYDRAAPGA